MERKGLRECVYTPGKPGIQDLVNPTTGCGVYSKMSLAEMQAEHSGIVIGNFDTVVREQDAYWIKPPVEITHERFDEMLNILPPVNWANWSLNESFQMSERMAGNVTSIFCRIGTRYFELQDRATISHDVIVMKVSDAMQRMEGNPRA